MQDTAHGTHPEAGRRRSRLGWVLVLGTVLGLVIGCGLQDSRLGRGPDPNGGFRWAAPDVNRLLRTAHYFKQLNQPELGAKELEEAHRLDPGNLEVADALAQYYEELGLTARAQEVYQETLALVPNNPALQNNFCFSYYQAGDWTQAETCFRKTLDRQPDNQAARNNLGLLLCRQGRQEEARRLWQAAEGDAVAGQRMAAALTALGLARGVHHPQAAGLRAPASSVSPASPAAGSRRSDPTIAAALPPPAPAAAPAVSPKVETPGPAPASPPAVVVAAVPAAPQAPPKGPDPGAGAPAAPEPGDHRVTPAPPRSQEPAPGPLAATRPERPLAPVHEHAVAPPAPVPPAAAPARPGNPALQPGLASHPAPPIAAAKTVVDRSRATSRRPITARELMETGIAILNGNGIQDLARNTRSRLSLEGYTVVAINNFRDFGVDRTVIAYRPDAAHLAAILSERFFPGAVLEPASRLAANIDVQVVLGHDLDPRYQAEAPRPHAPRL
jgi:Tfp pilus assembly protein PilF